MKISDYLNEPAEGRAPTTASIILQGHSGAGKSGATIPLAIPGLVVGGKANRIELPGRKLYVANTESPGKFLELALGVIEGMVASKRITRSQADAAYENIEVEDFADKVGPVLVRGQSEPVMGLTGKATAWKRLMKQLTEWSKVVDPHDVLVLDSYTRAALGACVNHYLHNIKHKHGSEPDATLEFKDYPSAQSMVARLLEMLPQVGCHVVVVCHPEKYELRRPDPSRKNNKGDKGIEYGEELIDSGYAPISIGQSGRMQVPAAYNHMLIVDIDDHGARKLYTKPRKALAAKTPHTGAAAEYIIADGGLAEYLWEIAPQPSVKPANNPNRS